MTVTVEECDPRKQRAVIIDVLARHLTPQSDERRFQWMYLDNPAGLARTWLARAGTDGPVIGMAAAFPRRLRINGKSHRGWVLGDFCMAEDYRSLGPSLKLQRACLSVVEGQDESLCYDFPSQSMMAVYRRLGIPSFRNVVRWAKPLKVDRKVQVMVGPSILSTAISTVGNATLRALDSTKGTDPSVTVTSQEHDCDAEFGKLSESETLRPSVSLERSPEYLNWRYHRNPLAHTEMITAHRFGRVAGYAVYATHDTR